MLRALGLLTVLVVGVSFYKKGKSFIENIIPRFEKLKLANVNWVEATIKLTCVIENKNSETIEIQGFEGTITQNSIILAQISTGAAIMIAKDEEKRLGIEFKVSNDKMLTRIQEIIRNPGDGLKPFELEGWLTINGFNLPVYQTVQLLAIG